MQFTSFLSVRLWVAAFLLISASQYHILAGDDVDQNRSVTFSNDQSSNEFSRRIFNTLDSLRKLHVVHRPLFLTPIRNDGVGAIILHMLYSAAYADIRGWAFAGVVRIDSRHYMFHPTKHDNVNEESVARFVFGRDMIFSADHFMGLMTTKVVVSSMHSKRGNKTFPSLGEIEGPPFKWQTIFFDSYSLRDYNWMLDKQVLQEPDYRSVNGNSTYERVLVLDPLLHEKFRRKLMASNQQLHKPDANKMLFSPERFSVALHLRRGDVLPTNRGRFTKDEYYLGIVKMIREVVPDADVQAFSSLEGFQNIENFKMYTENDITVHFEEHADVCVAWLNMIHADMLIMAKSAFSVVPALLNFQCVVYEPSDYLGKLEHWVTESTFNTSYIRNCYAASGKRKLLNARQSMSI